MHTGGTPVSPYLYDLSLTANGALSPVFRVGPDQLATVRARYHADSPGQIDTEIRQGPNGILDTTSFAAPFTRTEYLSPGAWGQVVDAYRPDGRAVLGEHYANLYQAGQAYTEDHLTPPTYPQDYVPIAYPGPRCRRHRMPSRW